MGEKKIKAKKKSHVALKKTTAGKINLQFVV